MAVAPNAAARPRSGAPYTILGLILAVVGFGAVLLFSSLSGGHGGGAAASGPQQSVVVAGDDISIRTAVAPAQLKVAKFAQADVPPGAFAKVDDLKGMVAAIDIKKGQPITANLLVKSGDAVTGPQPAYLPVPTGFVAFTIPTSEQQGVGGYIQTGDYISIIGLVTAPSGGQNVRTLFTNVHVIRVGPAAAGDPNSNAAPSARAGGVSSSLTIVVTQCQAEYLNWFLANQSIKYTLESYKDYKPQDVAVDATCPSVTSAKGVSKADINSRWPGIFNP